MKLGFWNRLAIVAGVVYSIGRGTWYVQSFNMEREKIASVGYELCMERVADPGSDLTFDFCDQNWLQGGYRMGLSEWAEAVGLYALSALLIYGLIWAAVSVARWVWRGRSVE